MSDEWPKFRVFVVKDGMASGLLIERQMSLDARTEKNYFWLAVADGLTPTEEILKACDGIHELLGGECNRIFVELLIRFTTFVQKTGILKVRVTNIGKYFSGMKCQRIIDHFFERGDIQLRHFFINAPTFKDSVLTKATRKQELVGEAEEFRVLSPHDIVSISSGYIKPISHVLKVGVGKARWFRREGPIAADFDGDTVYTRHPLLDKIRDMVFDNEISLLEGEPATGKTVLARQLGYQLLTKEKAAVYWFDGALERGFDKDKLIKEINSARGVVIIENVHLETPKYQRIRYSLKSDPYRHVLFTARPSFRESENSKDWRLSELKQIRLNPFDQVDEIIDHFTQQYVGVQWPEKARETIKNVSKESFWLLAYSLRGYVDSEGQGESKGWLEKGVREDLQELEKLEPCFPEVLISLSPLYKNEVRTEEYYLTKVLGFDQAILYELVCRGEITIQREDEEGYVFYGLPHSALADVYWRFGETYRRRRGFPDYEDFVFAYATSGVSNGLEAICGNNIKWSKNLFDRLEVEKKLVDVVEKERSMKAIALLWALLLERGVSVDSLKDKALLEALAEKINTHKDLNNSGDTLCTIHSIDRGASKELMRLIDFPTLSKIVNKIKDLDGITWFIECLCYLPGEFAKEFCDLLDPIQLVEIILLDSISNACRFINLTYYANSEVGQRIWMLLDLNELLRKVRKVEDVRERVDCVVFLYTTGSDICKDLYPLLDASELAKWINENLSDNYLDISPICQSCAGQFASKLCDFLNINALAELLTPIDNDDGVRECLRSIITANRIVGRELLLLKREKHKELVRNAKEIGQWKKGSLKSSLCVRTKLVTITLWECDNCGRNWKMKYKNPSCPNCDHKMGKEIKLFLSRDTCPYCDNEGIRPDGLKCSKCGFEAPSDWIIPLSFFGNA